MSIDTTIEELRAKIAEKEKELAEMKKTVNQLCVLAQHNPIYTTEIESEKSSIGLLRGDEYYMQPIARVIGWILERRKVLGAGPVTVGEIYDAMKAGGYKFDAEDDENAMRGISISMSKNTAKFHKLPSGKFGLTEWYPELKEVEEPKKGRKRRRRATIAKTTKEVIQPIEGQEQEGSVVIPKRRGRPPKEKPQEELKE